jgi:hypothetical protein
MNIDPISTAFDQVTGLFRQLLHAVPDQGVDDGSSLMMAALAGIALAITVALMLSIYVQTGYRSYRDMIRHGLVAALGLMLLAFAIYDMRNAALAHIAKARPAATFELQWQKTTERARELAAEMDGTTRSLVSAHQG